jgi:hypothetical protein
MNNYEYTDYDSLISSIINGELIINQPILVNNEKVSFLNNLLNYSNVNKENLHHILLNILNKIKYKLYEEKKNPNVVLLMKHTEDEWEGESKNLFCESNCDCLDNIPDFFIEKGNEEKLVNKLEEKLSEQKIFSQMIPEKELGDYSVIDLSNSVDDISGMCHKTIEKINNDLLNIDKEIEKLDNIDIHLLLDLSLKHTSLYKLIDENNTDDIHENIHNIFMNYTLMLNLLKKHMYHMRSLIIDVKDNILERCNFVNSFIDQLNTSKIKGDTGQMYFFE